MVSAEQVFEELGKKVKEDPSLVKTIKGVYVFKINTGAGEQVWTVDLKDKGAVSKGESKGDCTIIMKEDDFVNLMSGKLNGQQAFMQGKLKIKGNMGMAMKLGKLSAPKAKL